MSEAKKPSLKISVDDLFSGGDLNFKEASHGQIVNLDASELHDFPTHPFKVCDDDAMRQLADSIKEKGVLNPILVRPRKEGGYEVISGHRRKFACGVAGVNKLPAIAKEYDDDEAAILLVDSNVQRENVLPSERAFAYKMKMDAIKRQGARTDLTSPQVAAKFRSDDEVAKGTGQSGDTIRRFIRLTNLIPELLDMIDEKRIAFNPAVELSYLKKQEQRDLLNFIETEEATPSLSQAQRLKQLSQTGKLDNTVLLSVMTKVKPNQKEVFKFKSDDLVPHIHKSIKPDGYQDFIIKACDYYSKHIERNREKGVR